MLRIALLLFVLGSVAAQAANDAVDRCNRAAEVLDEIMAISDKSIPQDLLSKANCVAVVPNLIKGAFIVGGKRGVGVIACRGAEGKGWVGEVISPGTSVCGTGRSSIGKSDSPVRRSNTNRIPILVACTSAGTSSPPRRSVTNVGCAGTSKSQRSWCTVWNRQATAPVAASSATTDDDQ